MKIYTQIKFLMLLFFSMFTIQGVAQISITSNDFEAMLQTGTQLESYYDTVSTQVNVGSAGQNTWDFSGLVASIEYVSESVDKSTTPYADEFPDAEYATFYEGNFDTIFTKTWSYTSIENSVIAYGSASLANTTEGDVQTIIKYEPGWGEYKFPVNYLDENTFSGTMIIKSIMNVPGMGEVINTSENDVSVSQIVDGYGVMTLPGGKQVDALRMVETTTTTSFGFESSSTDLLFVAKSGEMVSVSPLNEGEISGTIAISDIHWVGGKGSGSNSETPEAPSNLSVTAGSESIDLMWTDNSDNEEGFIIERSGGAGNSLVAEGENTNDEYMVLDTVDADVETYTDTDVMANVEYTYRVSAYNGEMRSQSSETASTTIIATAAVTLKDSEKGFSLGQNYPNPFSSNTVISFEIPKREQVVLSVLNVEGKRLKVLLNEEMAKGEYNIDFNARGLESGVYFYQIRITDFVETKRMLITK